MAKLEFQDIGFEEKEESVVLSFLKIFEMEVDKAEFERIGEFELSEHAVDFPKLSDKELGNKFGLLLDKAFRGLRNKLTGNPAVYVHQNSGIPLFGTLYFGIVDRGTNIIEVKPITGCNIDCPFCSVDAGKSATKSVDYVVEDDYLAQEVERLVDFKQDEESSKDVLIDVFVNTHGEPLLYANIVSLVRKLRTTDNVNVISIITNGTMLTTKLADELIGAGLTQLNLSINAFDPEKAKELAGSEGYSVENVLEVARHVASRIKLIIAPVWIKGVNDDQIPKLAAFAKEIRAELGIQNYMLHKKGRKMAEQVEWEEFYKQLEEWEEQTGMKLRQTDHSLFKTKQMEKPFRKGDIVRAEITCAGRMKREVIAVSEGRCISVVGCDKEKGGLKIKILRDKDGVFVGEEV